MLYYSKNLRCLHTNFISAFPYTTSTNIEEIQFKPKFTEQETEKILETLNEATKERLSQFDISQTRIKNLEIWKSKNGRFNSLNEVLEVDGLGEKVLERLCNSIIANKIENQNITTVKQTTNSKSKRQILFPNLESNLANSLKNAVGIHLAPTGVSWAKLSCDKNELQCWNFHDFKSLPKKLIPSETFTLTQELISEIPVGDVYVMEMSQSISPQNGKQPQTTVTHQLELSSMLIALLNTDPRHNNIVNIAEELNLRKFTNSNKVYYLRANLPARMFKTLVGNERVSTTGIVTNLLEGTESFPCTKITSSAVLKEEYLNKAAVHKDIMGQALLLVITFMDLCVYRNSISFAAIAPGRR